MEKVDRIILWDFEGTLVERPGRWRSALMEVLDVNEPDHQIEMEQLRPYLRNGFPWHRPNETHSHINNADEWWSLLEPIFTNAYQGVGFAPSRAKELSISVRNAFINPDRFVIYDDTIVAITHLAQRGWRHAILSNHVPELQILVRQLGLDRYFNYCFSSGMTGYEKPNPMAFQHALETIGHPSDVWMIGDNINADIQGAESLGIPAILVRNQQNVEVNHYAQGLIEAVSIIEPSR